MPMSRDKKRVHLEELESTLGNAKGIVFGNYQGTKVKDLERLRRTLFDGQMSLRITKNRLLGLALRRRDVVIDQTILDHPLFLAASTEDEVGPAKLVKSFQKEVETVKIAGGILDGKFLTAKEVAALADLPTQDQLRAQLVGILASPLSGLVRTLQGPIAGLVNVLQAYQTSKQNT